MDEQELRAEVRETLQHFLEIAKDYRRAGLKMKDIKTPPGPSGFLLRFALFITEPECPCGGEHMECDHDEIEAAG